MSEVLGPSSQVNVQTGVNSTYNNDYNILPPYTDEEETSETSIDFLIAAASSDGYELPITVGSKRLEINADEAERARFRIVFTYFNAIRTKKDEVVAMLIDRGLVTADTLDGFGVTPLLTAVAHGDVRMVQELVDFGAQIDRFGNPPIIIPRDLGSYSPAFYGTTRTQRTPLQLAAALGNLTLVKLFLDTYHVDDSLIAPDGETALHLASRDGHKDVVNYLPLRRGGGWKRWKTHNARALERAKMAARRLYDFGKFFVWLVPKFLLWSVPKHMVVLPLYKQLKWAYEHRHGFLPWCKRTVLAIPKAIKKLGKNLWDAVKSIPKVIKATAKSIWCFLTKDLPQAAKAFWNDLVSLITVRIPAAAKTFAKWIVLGVKIAGSWIYSILHSVISLLHTAFSAVISFFRTVTLKDIWNGFMDLLHAVFVGLPTRLWSWIKMFGDVSYDMLAKLFGVFGKVLWWLGVGIWWLVQYVPLQIWRIIESLAGSISNGCHEVLVWLNPKR